MAGASRTIFNAALVCSALISITNSAAVFLNGSSAMLSEGILTLVAHQDDVERVNEVLTMHMGPDFILLNLSVEFRDEARAPDLEQSIERMDRAIKEAFPEVKRIFIEAESPDN